MIDPETLPSNSNSSKLKEKSVFVTGQDVSIDRSDSSSSEKGELIKPPVPFWKQLAGFFLVMGPRQLIGQLWKDVVNPRIVEILHDIWNTAGDYAFYGTDDDERGERGYTHYSSGGSSKKEDKTKAEKVSISDADKAKRPFNNVAFPTKEKALEVRRSLIERAAMGNGVPVSYFYDCAEVTAEYTDRYYGWKKFPDDLKVMPYKGKWVIALPKAQLLED